MDVMTGNGKEGVCSSLRVEPICQVISRILRTLNAYFS